MAATTNTAFLWQNVVGAVVVTVVGTIVSMLTGGAKVGPDPGKSAATRAA